MQGNGVPLCLDEKRQNLYTEKRQVTCSANRKQISDQSYSVECLFAICIVIHLLLILFLFLTQKFLRFIFLAFHNVLFLCLKVNEYILNQAILSQINCYKFNFSVMSTLTRITLRQHTRTPATSFVELLLFLLSIAVMVHFCALILLSQFLKLIIIRLIYTTIANHHFNDYCLFSEFTWY